MVVRFLHWLPGPAAAPHKPLRPRRLPAEPDFDVVRRNRKGPHAVPRAAGEYHIRDSSMNTRPAHEGGVPLTYIAVDYTRSGRPVRDSPPPRVGVFDAHDRAAQRSSLLVWNPHTKDWRMDGCVYAWGGVGLKPPQHAPPATRAASTRRTPRCGRLFIATPRHSVGRWLRVRSPLVGTTPPRRTASSALEEWRRPPLRRPHGNRRRSSRPVARRHWA